MKLLRRRHALQQLLLENSSSQKEKSSKRIRYAAHELTPRGSEVHAEALDVSGRVFAAHVVCDGKGEGVLVVIGQTLCRHSMASDDVLDILSSLTKEVILIRHGRSTWNEFLGAHKRAQWEEQEQKRQAKTAGGMRGVIRSMVGRGAAAGPEGSPSAYPGAHGTSDLLDLGGEAGLPGSACAS
eukprot:s2511_g4.t1